MAIAQFSGLIQFIDPLFRELIYALDENGVQQQEGAEEESSEDDAQEQSSESDDTDSEETDSEDTPIDRTNAEQPKRKRDSDDESTGSESKDSGSTSQSDSADQTYHDSLGLLREFVVLCQLMKQREGSGETQMNTHALAHAQHTTLSCAPDKELKAFQTGMRTLVPKLIECFPPARNFELDDEGQEVRKARKRSRFESPIWHKFKHVKTIWK